MFPDTPVTMLARIARNVTGESETVWTQFFEMYQTPIAKFAEYVGARGDGEDVAQDIFIKLVKILKNGGYHPERGKFRSYLSQLIRNTVIKRWRRAKVRGADRMISMDDDDNPMEIGVESETVAILDAKWNMALRESAIEHVLNRTALSRQSRDVYKAYVLEERPISEVADAFGLSKNSVSQIKTRVERMIAKYEAAYKE